MSQVLLIQFYTYFILMLAGFIAAKLKIIHKDNASFLSAFILKFTFPLLLITTIPHLPFHTDTLKNVLYAFIISYGSLFLLGISGILSSRFFRFSIDDKKIFILHSVFGNIVFIGFPFISSLFPSGEGLLYAAVFQIASDSLLWTAGISLLQKNKHSGIKQYLYKLFNINTFAFLAALLMWMSQKSIPPNIEKPFAGLGSTTLVLSLIYIGYILSQVSIDQTIRKACIYVFTFNKLILIPVIVLLFLHFVFPSLPKSLVTAMVLQTGMPAMTIVAILAKDYLDSDMLASENILVSTIFSIISLPLLWYLINLLYL